MPSRIPIQPRGALAGLMRRWRPGERIYLAGCCGEPTAVHDLLAADPALGRGVVFTGVWLPGVNRRDPTAGIPGASARTIFVTPELRDGFEARRVAFHPLSYAGAWRWLSGPARIDRAFFQVSPPEAGTVSLGVSGDFAPALAAAGAELVGLVNPGMPAPASAPRLPVDAFTALVDAPAPLLTYSAGTIPQVVRRIGKRIAGLIEPGDTVQLGLGKAQVAVLEALAGHRGLGFHGGMICDPLLPLVEANVFARGVRGAVALGSASFYQHIARERRVRFAPVGEIHTAAALAPIRRFTAINSVVEIDLFGQANAEMVEGRQISGGGGISDFVRGARAAEGGRAILALPSTAARGTVSRIRPALPAATPASVPRVDADIVVTEHGAAEIASLDLDARAEALIGIADPSFRDSLASAWDALRRAM